MTPDISAIAQKWSREAYKFPLLKSRVLSAMEGAIFEATASLRAQLKTTEEHCDRNVLEASAAKEAFHDERARRQKAEGERDAAISAIGPTERKLVEAERERDVALIIGSRLHTKVAFLLSCVKCGEDIDIAEEEAIRSVLLDSQNQYHPKKAVAQESPLNGKEGK